MTLDQKLVKEMMAAPRTIAVMGVKLENDKYTQIEMKLEDKKRIAEKVMNNFENSLHSAKLKQSKDKRYSCYQVVTKLSYQWVTTNLFYDNNTKKLGVVMIVHDTSKDYMDPTEYYRQKYLERRGLLDDLKWNR